MTINELEQGIRNLIASQPMAVAGPNGDVINGINSLIDAFRNLSFRVQSYPCQDVMKFGLANESAKLENTLSSLAVQVLQERGINIMLYIPRTNAGYGPMVNSYGVVGNTMDPNLMMGQMMYNASQVGPMPSMMGQMPNAMPNMGRPAYNQMQPQMMGVSQNAGYARPSRQSAPTFPGYQGPDRPVKLEPTQTTVQSMKTTRSAPQDKIKAVPKSAAAATVVKQETAPVVEEPAPEIPVATGPSPAEMLMGASAGGAGDGKAKGRDYLMELLKKQPKEITKVISFFCATKQPKTTKITQKFKKSPKSFLI